MGSDSGRVLTVNGGSSSIKFALFEAGDPPQRVLPHRLLRGSIERIGSSDATFSVSGVDRTEDVSQPVDAAGYTAAVEALIGWVEERAGRDRLSAVGHRVVHGGPHYSSPQPITAELVAELHRLSPFDPEHLPEEIRLTEAFHDRFPDLPQVACFDTAFHHEMPRVAQLVSIPRRYQARGVRRYGFHGLSYTFLVGELARRSESGVPEGRVVLAHLGSGASLAAVHDGRPVDTSMGFTPNSGVPMSTRSGDLDPGLLLYLARTEGLDTTQLSDMVNSRSGLLGVSDTSSDMRDLLARASHDARAQDAVSLFCYEVKKWIGAFAAALGGLDTLVFAGGIGENAPEVRSRVCDGLGFLGIELDEHRNSSSGGGTVSNAQGHVDVQVIRTDEESVIAEMTAQVIGLATKKENLKP